ncbi:MAG TPA: hypothetical protein VKS98_06645, partial [Chthoniobacterales bacterium]|nr:hypothetical protein [Chthoniobacterales bacterium]
MKTSSNSKQAILTLLALLIPVAIFIAAAPVDSPKQPEPKKSSAQTDSLKPPDKDPIPVAFLISDRAVVIDFCGPWEVFQDTNVPSRQDAPFRLYTVAETTKPIRTSGGMQIVPDYT